MLIVILIKEKSILPKRFKIFVIAFEKHMIILSDRNCKIDQ